MYKDLEIEIARMRKLRIETIPVVTGALGVIKEGQEKYVVKIPGTVSIDELQKISSHLEKGPVNQVNSLVPEAHGLDPVLQRLNKQAKDYK